MSNNFWVGITQVNKTERYGLSDTEYHETKYDNTSELYRALVKEYGRCIGRLYVDMKDDSTKHIGWVFVKRMRYDDVPETFLCETWVSIYTEKPRAVMIEKFAEL